MTDSTARSRFNSQASYCAEPDNPVLDPGAWSRERPLAGSRVFRLIQTGDLHLGSPFAAWPEQAAVMQQAQIAAFGSILEACRTQLADLLLITGDLFDRPVPDEILVHQVITMLASLADTATHVFIVPGNHDPAVLDSPYRTASWPSFVTVFSEQPAMVELVDLQVRIYGVGFAAAVATSPLLVDLQPPPDPAWCNLLLLHGDVQNSMSSSIYNPVSLQWLQVSALDYVALGHVHQFSGLQVAGSTAYAYSGCPMGRGFDETGPKGYLAGTIRLEPVLEPGPGPRPFRFKLDLAFMPLSGRQFIDLSVDISGCQDQPGILACIQEALASQDFDRENAAATPAGMIRETGNDRTGLVAVTAGRNRPADHFYKITLTGAVAAEAAPVIPFLHARLASAVFYLKLQDQTTRVLDLATLARENSLRGVFVRLANERIAAARQDGRLTEAEQLELARSLGLRAMAGAEVLFNAAD